ncbi:alpha/beta-Hydrolases superfamily protein [Striga hermonthica]|uniref:Alpha/beta-Hydrolases superfamily protein n=1 Tax=Striga hermonthica TaxID=68872 RepID=A0A9N7R6W2_STRHE|nr:alpha/beta-Hydrolases superfamily protein [Striga hermonthica]
MIKATFSDFISDLLALLDALTLSKVCLIGKDFGARIVYLFSLFHPERVSGIITLGVPFVPPSRPTNLKPLDKDLYISRWQDPGRAEADFSRFNCKTVVKNIYILFSRDKVPRANGNREIMDIVDPLAPLPLWFTMQDLEIYASLYQKSGFQTALQVPYRSLHEEFDIMNLKVEVPALVITGGKDYSLNFPGIEDYIKSGRSKVYVPNYETEYLPEGSHFMQEQFPDKVNQLILNFLNKL